MIVFYDRFEELCRKNNLSPSKAAVEAGINKSAVTYWKSNADAKPTGQIAERLCNYFGISMSELYGDETKKVPTLSGAQPKSKLRSIARLEDSKITPDQDAQIADYIDYLLSKRDKNK